MKSSPDGVKEEGKAKKQRRKPTDPIGILQKTVDVFFKKEHATETDFKLVDRIQSDLESIMQQLELWELARENPEEQGWMLFRTGSSIDCTLRKGFQALSFTVVLLNTKDRGPQIAFLKRL